LQQHNRQTGGKKEGGKGASLEPLWPRAPEIPSDHLPTAAVMLIIGNDPLYFSYAHD
jgi:hypothetical protein